jgi:hypothetical protein
MSNMNPIKEIEKNLQEMDFKDFYRWIVINMPRLSGEKNTTPKKRGGELSMLHSHPRHNQSKY